MEERIVALDVGERRVGVAVSDPLGLTAQPVETYTRVGYGPDARHILEIASRYGTRRILCGLPRNMDGTEGFQVERVREFARQLEAQGLSVSYYDERMTTVLAEQALLEADMRRDKRKQKVDMIAAVMILQSYLDTQRAAQEPDALQESDAPQAAEDGEQTDELEMEDEDGNVVRFRLVSEIEYKGERYVLFSALEDGVDIAEGETILMQLTQDEQGETGYRTLEDDDLIAAVYEAYLDGAQ